MLPELTKKQFIQRNWIAREVHDAPRTSRCALVATRECSATQSSPIGVVDRLSRHDSPKCLEVRFLALASGTKRLEITRQRLRPRLNEQSSLDSLMIFHRRKGQAQMFNTTIRIIFKQRACGYPFGAYSMHDMSDERLVDDSTRLIPFFVNMPDVEC